MELIYSFDSKRFRLGKLCLHGHAWPGTTQSLRRIHATASDCAGCNGRKSSSWLISFIDSAAMGIPKGWHIGKLCAGGHQWRGHKMTLRNLDNKCIECEQQRRQSDKYKAATAKWRTANADLLKQQERAAYEEKKKRADEDSDYAAELRSRQAQATYRCRLKNGRPSRAKGATGEILPADIGRGPAGLAILARGLAVNDLPLAIKEHKDLWTAIRQAGNLPSVPKLVLMEQRRHWLENPEGYKEFNRQRSKRRAYWRCMTDLEYRLYHRQKSRRRKALERGSVGIQVKGSEIAKRFAEFGNCCAYCGNKGLAGKWLGLQADHVNPISTGGTHVLSNLVPACRTCNYSKSAKDAEVWYRAQPFFCKKRWAKILKVMGAGKGSPQQLALL